MTDYGPPALPGPEEPEQWLTTVIKSVQGPGAALQWFGMFSVGLTVLSLVLYLVSPDTIYQPVYKYLEAAQKDQPAEQRAKAPLPPYKKWAQQQQLWSIISLLVSLAGSFVTVIGGMKMRQMSGYGWAMAGAVLATLPCTNSCCCAGLPVGMWALVALVGSDVRRAFARVSDLGGLEAYEQGPGRSRAG